MKMTTSMNVADRHIRKLSNVLGIVLGKIRWVAKKCEKRM